MQSERGFRMKLSTRMRASSPLITLNLVGRDRISFTLIHSPISVAIEQCGTVGVKVRSTAEEIVRPSSVFG